jgi:hypothetical protein
MRDDQPTTTLPRTAERRQRLEDTLDDEAERPPLGQRAKLALMIAGVAAVVILGLAFGYAALHIGKKPAPAGGPTAGASPSTASSPSGGNDVAILGDSSMITPQNAQLVDRSRTWKVESTTRGLDASSPRPACLPSGPLDAQPAPQQTILRQVSSSGKNPPGLLHEADSYASPEEAAQAYAVTAKAIGGCTMAQAYVQSGSIVTGLGDEAFGVVVSVTAGSTTTYRSVVVNRTGRVVNLVDVAQPDSGVNVNSVVKALAAVTAVQCTTSGGACATSLSVHDGPPPLGGDQPGFLAAGDLPPVGKAAPVWVGDPPNVPSTDFTGSQCETLDWSKVPATNRTMRTYLQQDSAQAFGLDEIIITGTNEKAAADLVKKIKSDLDTCAKRKLTATVSSPRKVSGPGAQKTAVTGWTATVQQKATTGTATYRVGIVSAGTKTVFTFLNPLKGLDLTDAQFDAVAVRAGQRATQIQ